MLSNQNQQFLFNAIAFLATPTICARGKSPVLSLLAKSLDTLDLLKLRVRAVIGNFLVSMNDRKMEEVDLKIFSKSKITGLSNLCRLS